MGLSTHVLDTAHGCPAAGMAVTLYKTEGANATLVKQFQLNSDGRNPDGPLYDNASLQKAPTAWCLMWRATSAPGRAVARSAVPGPGEH